MLLSSILKHIIVNNRFLKLNVNVNMPALSGYEEKYFNGYKVDKENDDVIYSDEKHIYLDKKDKQAYVSVTSLIHQYQNPFDEDFWSSYKALESIMDVEDWIVLKPILLSRKKFFEKTLDDFNIDKEIFIQKKQEILTEYERKRNESCERGTKIHANFEESFYGKSKFDFKRFGFGEIGCKEFICNKDYYKLDLHRGVYPEFLISCKSDDGLLRLSGQIDFLCVDENDVYICDWKGLPLDTAIATPSGWTTMGDLKVGDNVFDKNGEIVEVLVKSKIHNNPCYKIKFDNNDEIIADKDHRWEVSFKRPGRDKVYKWISKVLTTEEIKKYIETHNRQTYYIPKIINPKPLNLPDKNLPIDPYVLGCWLGDGNASSGMITNCANNIWSEIKKRGYKIGPDIKGKREGNCEQHTVYGLRTELRKLGLLNNKHIPEIYLRASYEQRLDLLRGLMDTDGYFHPLRKRFVMGTTQDWQCYDFAELLATFGIKTTIFKVNKLCSNTGTRTQGYDVTFTTDLFNPFLSRNQDIPNIIGKDNHSFRTIVSIEEVDVVPTQCIEVSGNTHTYLAGKQMIVTHNTNKELKKTGFFDKSKKSKQMLKYPLNNLEDCNFNVYQLQLSTYAYMLQVLRPELNIKKLIIYHIDHDGKETVHECKYLKTEVIRMLNHYKKQVKIKQQLDKDKPVNLC